MIDRLLAEPHRFGFFQAVRLLDRWAGIKPGATALNKVLFRNSLSLSFAPSEVESLAIRWHGDVWPSSADGHVPPFGQVSRIELTPSFIGLLGAQGALPSFYTETFVQRELYQKDGSGRAFVDLFSNRAVALFYMAWRKHRLPLQFEADQTQRFLPQVLALAGLGHRSLRARLDAARGGVADEALAFHAAAIHQRRTPPKQLGMLLASYLGVAVEVRSFIGRWYTLPDEAKLRLGQAPQGGMGAQLGRSAVLGERVWQRDLCLRVEIGPLDHGLYRRFLPGGTGALALRHWLTLLGGAGLTYEVQLGLRRSEIRGVDLASSRSIETGRLGWDTFLQSRAAPADRMDVRYDIEMIA